MTVASWRRGAAVQLAGEVVLGDFHHRTGQRHHADEVRQHHQAVEGVGKRPCKVQPHHRAQRHQRHEQHPVARPCPCAAITSVFAVQFGYDEDLAAGSVVITTFISIVVLPLCAMALTMML